ncbi:MAG: carboxypeptidase-like regulatory domain-containing protein [Saprospiraceae bacterium]|nr:carboxypeptidase-like regulatory domain-containing protein [Saprospiraceae bacterium]
MKKTLFFLFLVVGLIGTSCRKNDDIITGGPDPVIYVQTQLMGVINDENGIGLEGVGLRWGQQLTTTDENGFYTFSSAAADREGTILQITANGYFDLTKTVVPIPNGRTWTEAMLTPKVLSGSVQASAGGTVTISGASVTLPAGGIVGSGNVPYTGAVQVYATWLDPTGAHTLARMPGNLTAINTNNESGSLATYGMIGVELESPSGAPLQIAAGAEARIELTIPDAVLSSAPATIPLWHFDVVKGKWLEDGFAEKVGNQYVGTVSHFSFWNCDVFFENVTLSGRVVNLNGAPIIGIRVRATMVNSNPSISASASAWTNDKGEFSGKVPAGETLLIEVLDQCDNVVFSQEIGPLNVDLDMGDLVVDLSDKAIAVTGTLVDCDDNPVSDGYIKIQVEGKTVLLPTAADGTVDAVVSTCDADELTATGYDVANLKVSPSQTYTITGLNEVALGTLAACDVLEEYIHYTLDGVSTLATDPGAGIQGNFLTINGGNNSQDSTYYYMTLDQILPGTYNPTTLSALSFDSGSGIYYFGSCQGCMDMQVTLTTVGNIGEPIIGTFTGTLNGNPGNPMVVPLTGSFKVIRDN